MQYPTSRPSADRRAEWVIASGSRYWQDGSAKYIRELPFPSSPWIASGKCILVGLPAWAAGIGVGTPPAILVDSASIAPGDGNIFDRCNWLCAAYLFLCGAQEKGEQATSYSGMLHNVDKRLFDRAWVNRIFLLLRQMAARNAQASEMELFGERPRADFRITHDVDAIHKTPEIRFKQTAFHLINTARSLTRGRFAQTWTQLGRAARFTFTSPSYWNFPAVRKLEMDRGIRSTFNFYGGPAGWHRASIRRILIDPSYDVSDAPLRQELASLQEGGWAIGLHPSFESWNNPVNMAMEREAVERACGAPVTECRQHWLRFSWAESWRTQSNAGLKFDTTLGFNDRPGFRNAAALRFHPWDSASGKPLEIEALPMVFMDSHFYDYGLMDDEDRRAAMAYWIGEVQAVGGEASLNWHVHTLAPDYGWKAGFIDLLDTLV